MPRACPVEIHGEVRPGDGEPADITRGLHPAHTLEAIADHPVQGDSGGPGSDIEEPAPPDQIAC